MREAPPWRAELAARIRDRRARVAVVGLGQVGLVLLVAARRAGFDVVGVDTDEARLAQLAAGRSYLEDVPAADVAGLEPGRLSRDATAAGGADVVVVCVPTPLAGGRPDLAAVRSAMAAVARCLRPGTLVVLESTVGPARPRRSCAPCWSGRG